MVDMELAVLTLAMVHSSKHQHLRTEVTVDHPHTVHKRHHLETPQRTVPQPLLHTEHQELKQSSHQEDLRDPTQGPRRHLLTAAPGVKTHLLSKQLR